MSLCPHIHRDCSSVLKWVQKTTSSRLEHLAEHSVWMCVSSWVCGYKSPRGWDDGQPRVQKYYPGYCIPYAWAGVDKLDLKWKHSCESVIKCLLPCLDTICLIWKHPDCVYPAETEYSSRLAIYVSQLTDCHQILLRCSHLASVRVVPRIKSNRERFTFTLT